MGTSTRVRGDLMVLPATRPVAVVSVHCSYSPSSPLLTERALIIVSSCDTQVLENGNIKLGYSIDELSLQGGIFEQIQAFDHSISCNHGRN